METPMAYVLRTNKPLMLSKLLRAGAAITCTQRQFNHYSLGSRGLISREWAKRALRTTLSLLRVGKRRRPERDIFNMLARETWAQRLRYPPPRGRVKKKNP